MGCVFFITTLAAHGYEGANRLLSGCGAAASTSAYVAAMSAHVFRENDSWVGICRLKTPAPSLGDPDVKLYDSVEGLAIREPGTGQGGGYWIASKHTVVCRAARVDDP